MLALAPTFAPSTLTVPRLARFNAFATSGACSNALATAAAVAPQGAHGAVGAVTDQGLMPNHNLPVLRPFVSPRPDYPICPALCQPRRHHPWVKLRPPLATLVCHERRRQNPIHRFLRGVRNIVLRRLGPLVHRQTLQLRLITLRERRHQETADKGQASVVESQVHQPIRQAVKEGASTGLKILAAEAAGRRARAPTAPVEQDPPAATPPACGGCA